MDHSSSLLKNKKAAEKSVESQKKPEPVTQPKHNPFDQKVKNAIEDDEDEEIILKPVEKKPAGAFGVAQEVSKKREEDNGLFVDNDFGDDFDDEEEDEEATPKNEG